MFFASVVRNTLAFCLVAVFALSAQQVPQRVISKGNVDYLSNELIIKFRFQQPTDAAGSVTPLASIAERLEFLQVKKAKTLLPVKAMKATTSGLDRIVSVTYAADIDPLYAATKLAKVSEIEWIEPRSVYKSTLVPNDPLYNQQWYLPKIKAPEAWDINQGSPSIVVGIDDTGVDWDHPDLV